MVESKYGVKLSLYPILSSFHRKRDTETDIKWSLPYSKASVIEGLELTVTQQSTLLRKKEGTSIFHLHKLSNFNQ